MPSVFFTQDDMCTTIKLEIKKIYDFFIRNDWTIASDIESSDLVLCLTCSGWQKLEDKSIERLFELQKSGKRVVALGCVNDNNPEAISEVHSGTCISTRTLEDIESLIPNPKVRLSDIEEPSTFKSKEDYRLYDLRKRFVNIALGCSFSCTYCPHKIGLGPLRSRSIESITDQISELLKEDVRIVVLTGMETAWYGTDIGTNYTEMLNSVMQIKGDFQIHVAQFNPSGLLKDGDELVSLLSNERITDIQMPIQTTSDRLLKMMGRPGSITQLGESFERIRNQNSKVILRTDVIVGFPSETMEELDASLDFATHYFDEIAVYGIEVRKGLPIERYSDQRFGVDELNRRIAYAVEYVEKKGRMAHGGQQADVDLIEVEARKQRMREIKNQAI